MNKINNLLKEKCGIYIITNLVNGNRYIGSSKDLKERLKRHVWELNKNIHVNPHLQNAWNKYGSDSFEYSILEFCNIKEQFDREDFYLRTLKPEYNVEQGAIKVHHSEEQKKKISQAIKARYKAGLYPSQKYTEMYYIYDIRDWSLFKSVKGLNQAAKCFYRDTGTLKKAQVNCGIIKDHFVICDVELKSQTDIKNFIYKNAFKYKTNNGSLSYLAVYSNKQLYYFRTTAKAVSFMNCSSDSTLKKHRDATINNPYNVPNTEFKVFWTNHFIPINDNAVLCGNIEEYHRTNSEEVCKTDDPEVIS